MARKWKEESLKAFRKYQSEFNKENYKAFAFRLKKDEEADIIEFLQGQESLVNYLRKLIVADMKKQSKAKAKKQ